MNVLSSPRNSHSKSKNQLTKSRSPDHRQKLPPFKPKTLNQIYNQNKLKSSTESLEKLLSSKSKKLINQQKKTILDKTETSAPPINKVKKQKNSLQDFIKQSGHGFQVQSQQFQISQYDDEFIDEQFADPKKHVKKYADNQYQVLTPQYSSFSKGFQKQQNLFQHKDDSFFKFSSEKQQKKLWNGFITLSTSICYDEASNDQFGQNIPSQLKDFIDESRFNVSCRNIQNNDEYFFNSQKEITIQQLSQKLKILYERNHNISKIGSILNSSKTKSLPHSSKTGNLKVVLMAQKMIQDDKNPGQIQNEDNNLILKELPHKRFYQLNYKIQFQNN